MCPRVFLLFMRDIYVSLYANELYTFIYFYIYWSIYLFLLIYTFI